MEKAIKKAILGGYDVKNGYQQEKTVGDRDRFALLDPLFWKALRNQLEKENTDKEQTETKEWRYFADRFWDWNMKGKDIDSFFNNLLTDH